MKNWKFLFAIVAMLTGGHGALHAAEEPATEEVVMDDEAQQEEVQEEAAEEVADAAE